MQMEFLGFWQTFEEYSCHTHFEPTSYAYTYFLVQGNGKGTIFFEKFQYVSSKYHKYLITISTISLQKIFRQVHSRSLSHAYRDRLYWNSPARNAEHLCEQESVCKRKVKTKWHSNTEMTPRRK
jgi:hypothetical protein